MAFDGCCVVSIEPGGELFKPPASEGSDIFAFVGGVI